MSDTVQVENAHIEHHGGISVIRTGAGNDYWSSVTYDRGLSARTVGSKILSMNVAYLPPGGVIEAHIHDGFEVGLYQLQGRCEYHFGPGLSRRMISEPGDFLFVEPGLPHAVYNLSDTEPCVTVVARTSPDEWDKIIPYDPALHG
jgi:uncharacterized RmlC-like cupin family protein